MFSFQRTKKRRQKIIKRNTFYRLKRAIIRLYNVFKLKILFPWHFFAALMVLVVVARRNKWKICSLSARTSYKLVSADLPYRVFRDSTFPRDEERRRCTQVDKNLPRWPMSVECVPSSGSTSRVSRRDSRQNKMTIDILRTPSLAVSWCF